MERNKEARKRTPRTKAKQKGVRDRGKGDRDPLVALESYDDP